jgi:hypothetical protein
MTVLQVLTHHLGEDEYTEAGRALEMLATPDECDPEVRELTIQMYQEALAVRIRHTALMHAFRETETTAENDLSTLGRTALEKVSNLSFVTSVAEHVYDQSGVRNDTRLYPNLANIVLDTMELCRKIVGVLTMSGDESAELLDDEDWGEPPAGFYAYDRQAI